MESYTLSSSEDQRCLCPFSLAADVPIVRVKEGSKIRNLLRFSLSRLDPHTRADPGPGSGPEQRPGSGPEQRPGSGPEQRPGSGPEQRPGSGPEQRPGSGPEQRPGSGPEQRPGSGPEQRPGSGCSLGADCRGRSVVVTAEGKAASKAISCVEILKRRVPGLHQVTQLAYSSLVDRWDPLDPALGLEPLSVRRNTPCLWVLLSTVPLDRGMLGYQRPGHHCDLWGGVASEHKLGSRKRRGGGARAHRQNRPQIS